ncbi:hypothetical protein [Streptomyces sp. 6N223]|uniref:hypothetical protein n=1 Tax=Streptomyces sp. 6N223 TaxID=3457412 RepID=UPI003FD4EDDD
MEAMEHGAAESEGWADMITTLRPNGLPIPPVPAPLRADLAVLGSWYWGTPDAPGVQPIGPMELYTFAPSLFERLRGDGDGTHDRVAVCHAGHGASSYAITYGLVYRGLVLLIQAGWGGAYMDNDAQAASLAQSFRSCQGLIDRAEGREPEAGRHLVAAESELRGTALCGWAPVEGPVRPHLDRVRYGTVLAEAERLLDAA